MSKSKINASKKLRITNQKDVDILDDQEEYGRIISETEQTNKRLPCSR
jgi:hypothetical protein